MNVFEQMAVFTLFCIIVSMYYENGTVHNQTIHISRIMMSDELYPMVSDVYFGNGEHTFGLCETMQRFILQNESSYRYVSGVLVHDFLETELSVLDNEYMATIYKPQSFPYTYRKNAYVKFTNTTANYLYRQVCKDYYKDGPADSIVPSLLIVFMILVTTCHLNWNLRIPAGDDDDDDAVYRKM